MTTFGSSRPLHYPIPSGLSTRITVNPLPLPCVTFPDVRPTMDTSTAKCPTRRLHVVACSGKRLEATAAPKARKGLFLLEALNSGVQSIQNASGSRASQRKTSGQPGTKAELLPRQRRARSRPRGASFRCVALLSTCTKAGGPQELILLDTWPLILGPRPL